MDLQLILNEPNILSTKRKRPEEDSSPSERLTAPHLPQSWSRNSESICDQCSHVDWASVPTLAACHLLDRGVRVLRPINENSSQLAASSCRICRILSLINFPSIGQRQCIVYAKRLSDQWSSSAALVHGSKKITVLSIAPETHDIWPADHPKCLVALENSGHKDCQLILPRSVNYEKLKDLIRSCEETHGSLCTAGSFYQVSGLRVIDVSSRAIVVAPQNCRYHALSYVWGQQPDIITGGALRGAPPVIEDAMSVAIALGCKYLWVDRYCIPQNSPQDKHRMISKMDQVYADAFATVIAAAGENVQMGLPGVSISPRQPQQRVDVQNTTLLELPYGEDDLLSSKWASRGWTYQEGYLSKRRIIFTTHQVLFLCNKQYLEEYVHQDSPPYRQLGNLSGIFPIPRPPELVPPSNLLRQVQHYSQRELSYSSDSFNAFRGILNYHTTGRFSTPTHLGWGLLARTDSEGESLCLHLDWYHGALAKRRHEFPSWAWTGWGGPLTFGEGILVRRKDASHLPRISWEVSLEAEGGKMMDMCDFASICLANARVENNGLYPSFSEASPRRLLITCQVLPIHFRKNNLTMAQINRETRLESESSGWFANVKRPARVNSSLAVLQVWEGIYIGSPYLLDQDLNQKDCVIGLLFFSRHDHRYNQIGCLMARQVEDGSYERVGLVRNISPSLENMTGFPMIFWDQMGSVIDSIKIPEMSTAHALNKTGERKTICLL